MTYIIRVVPSGCQIEDSSTSSTPHMLNFATINELRCSTPNNGQFSITYQGGNLPYVFPSYNQITAFYEENGTNLGAPTSSTQLYNWLKQYVFDVYAGGSGGGGGGGTQDVNITQVNGVSPADLATETTLAFVPTYIGNPDDTDAAGDYSKMFALSNLFRGYWRDFGDWVGKNNDPGTGTPNGTFSLISLVKGLYNWFQATLQFGSGTQAGALLTTQATDSPLVTNTGAINATQATTSISGGTEITSDNPVTGLLKLIAAKQRGQTGTRSVNATLNGADATLVLGGQTYKDYGIHIIALVPSGAAAITITISASAVSVTSGGNFDPIHVVTIPANAVQQRTYEILLNRPARALRFNCTGGSGGTNILNIAAACY